MTEPPDAARRHLEERIEAFIAGYEASGQQPDSFAGEYLVRALASLKAGDHATGEARLRLAETPAERRSPEDIATSTDGIRAAVDGGASPELRADEARAASVGARCWERATPVAKVTAPEVTLTIRVEFRAPLEWRAPSRQAHPARMASTISWTLRASASVAR